MNYNVLFVYTDVKVIFKNAQLYITLTYAKYISSVNFFNIPYNFNHVFQLDEIKTDKSEKLPLRADEVGLKPRPSLGTPEALSFFKDIA